MASTFQDTLREGQFSNAASPVRGQEEGGKLCGACAEAVNGFHCCKLVKWDENHTVPLHSHLECRHVVMPVEGFYFCSYACVSLYNTAQEEKGGITAQMPDTPCTRISQQRKPSTNWNAIRTTTILWANRANSIHTKTLHALGWISHIKAHGRQNQLSAPLFDLLPTQRTAVGRNAILLTHSRIVTIRVDVCAPKVGRRNVQATASFKRAVGQARPANHMLLRLGLVFECGQCIWLAAALVS